MSLEDSTTRLDCLRLRATEDYADVAEHQLYSVITSIQLTLNLHNLLNFDTTKRNKNRELCKEAALKKFHTFLIKTIGRGKLLEIEAEAKLFSLIKSLIHDPEICQNLLTAYHNNANGQDTGLEQYFRTNEQPAVPHLE